MGFRLWGLNPFWGSWPRLVSQFLSWSSCSWCLLNHHMTCQLAKPLFAPVSTRTLLIKVVTCRNMVSRVFPCKALVQYHITAAMPPSGLKHGSLKTAGSQRAQQPTTNVECTFSAIWSCLPFISPLFISRRCSSRSRRSSFGPRRILGVRRPTPVSSTFTRSWATSRSWSTTTTRSDWGDGSLPQLPPAVPFLPYL